MISFKNISTVNEQAFLLSEDETPLAKCLFSVSSAEILDIICFKDCHADLLVTLLRAVLNHLDLQGFPLVKSNNSRLNDILTVAGFEEGKGESLYSLNLAGYFKTSCCKE